LWAICNRVVAVKRRFLFGLVALGLAAASCGGSAAPIATINGIEIERERFDDLHSDVEALVPEERASSLLLLMIHEAFLSSAEAEFGVVPDPVEVEAAFTARTDSALTLGPLEAVLANRGITTDRVQLEAELDVLRDTLGPELVRREYPGFDLDAAYQAYLIAEAEVCLRQITLSRPDDFDVIQDRLASGESFEDVARDLSADPLASRPVGESGSGGDMGCAAPSSFGPGLDQATLEAPLNEPYGPVVSGIGVHLAVVYDRTAPELESVRDDVMELATTSQGPQLFNRWAVGVLDTAEVTIIEEFGTWGPREGTDGIPTVIPPGG
jgi:hypothetical protein